MGFRKPSKAIGLDIGTHAVKAVQMSKAGGRLRIDHASSAVIDRNQLNADPVQAQVVAVRAALQNMPVTQSLVVGALTGQTVVMRYPRLTDVPRDQLSAAVQREAANNIPFELKEVFLDWLVLDEYREEESRQLKVLIVAARHEVIDLRLQVFQGADVACGVLSVDSLALADAGEACGFFQSDETVALIDVGLTSSSVHFVKNGVSNFIREVNWGAREVIQALAKARRCGYEEALEMLEKYGHDLGEVPEAVEALETELNIPSIIDEEVPLAGDPFGDGGEGGASLLDPLDEEFDNVTDAVNETFAPSVEPVIGRKVQRFEEIVAGPLNRMGLELRRSFDFYEHQLYEQPVDRVILGGGAAALSLVAESLKEELGFSSIEIADTANSALLFGSDYDVAPLREHPAQFLVAVGLAARGMADL